MLKIKISHLKKKLGPILMAPDNNSRHGNLGHKIPANVFFSPSETIDKCPRLFGTSDTWSETVHYCPLVPTRCPANVPNVPNHKSKHTHAHMHVHLGTERRHRQDAGGVPYVLTL